MLAEPVTHPLAVFGEIALAPVTVCRCSRPQYRAGFILVAYTPVTVAYALLVKIAKPLLCGNSRRTSFKRRKLRGAGTAGIRVGIRYL